MDSNSKSLWSKVYSDYLDQKKLKQLERDERKKTRAIIEERMKVPLQGNLALNFLFKDQDFSDIIKMKAEGTPKDKDTRQSTATFRDSVLSLDEENKQDVTQIQGYYTRK